VLIDYISSRSLVTHTTGKTHLKIKLLMMDKKAARNM